jgi:hypothetical protein
VFLFSLLLIAVLIHLPVNKVLLLLIGRVYTIIQLIRVLNLIGLIGVVASTRVVAPVRVTRN